MSQYQPPATNPPETNNNNELPLPLPAIICIAIGAYVLLVVIILFIRSMLLQRGVCKEQCSCCGKEGQPACCECWIAMAESCNCCKNPNMTACLDAICPKRKQMDCADVIMCNICLDEDGQCTCCGGDKCDCGNCKCNCRPPELANINCLCCECQGNEQPMADGEEDSVTGSNA